jgi:hypothetical protein
MEVVMAIAQTPVAERRSMPERTCAVCLEGVYVTKLETDGYSGPSTLRRMGLTSGGMDVLWHVEACNRCGHVQVFRRDWRR